MTEEKLCSYPKIYTLGHKSAGFSLLGTEVVVQEKVDGSQFSFGMLNGDYVFRSNGAVIDRDDPPKMFKAGVEHIMGLDHRMPGGLLPEGVTFRCELLAKPKHNSLRYDRVPVNGIMLFDVDLGEGAYLMDREGLTEWAYTLNVEPVPELFRGVINSMDEILEFMDLESVLGGQKIEGVVIKNYGMLTEFGDVAMSKFVSDGFKEVQERGTRLARPNEDVVDLLIGQLSTEARWQKAVQHLDEIGVLQNASQDIGPLIREVAVDVEREEAEAIKEALFKRFWPAISRGVTKGVPDWYKGELAKRAFGEE